MNKILEIKDSDFLKGESISTDSPYGGLFDRLENCDPFETPGLALPGLSPNNQTLATTPQFLTSFNSSGTNYIYAHSNTKLYQVLQDSPYTVVDKTSEIYQHLAIGTAAVTVGRVIWKGKYVYITITSSTNGYISANSLPVASGNDVLLKNGLGTATATYLPMEVGADGNCYFAYGQLTIGELTSATGTSGNSNLFYIDEGYYIRELINDGRYLVILADNNTENMADRKTGSYKCKVYFWDMVQTDASGRITTDQTFDLNDSWITGGRYLDGGIYFFGNNGLYVCNSATPPRLIRPYATTSGFQSKPLNASQVVATKGRIWWIDGTSTSKYDVLAYGNPITGQQKILARPFTRPIVAYLMTCLLISGDTVVMGTNQSGLYFFTGTTRGELVLTTINYNLPSPFTFDLVKITLSKPLAQANDFLQCVVISNDNQISAETKSYNSANPNKQTFIFKRVATSPNQPSVIENYRLTINLSSHNDAAIQRIAVYASPLNDINEIV